MDTFVTLYTFNHPGDASVIILELEQAGIECLLLDESTIWTQPLLSHAIGGVRLQVRGHDAPRALEILRSFGHANPGETERRDVLSGWDKATSNLPLLGSVRVETRIVLLAIIVVLVLSTITSALLWLSTDGKWIRP